MYVATERLSMLKWTGMYKSIVFTRIDRGTLEKIAQDVKIFPAPSCRI
jgi:hypothetical protein